jgi:regulatory protein
VRTKKASSRFRARRDQRDAEDSGPLVAGTVTAVERQKRPRSERVNVRIDGAFAFSLTADAALTLTPGEELVEAHVRELLDRDAAERAYQRAIRFLAARPRSAFEVRHRLRAAGFHAEHIGQAIGRLQQAGLLDDEEFANYWVGQRQAFRPRGPRGLRAELRAKGITSADMTPAIDAATNEQGPAACRAALQEARRRRSDGEHEFTRAVTSYLARRGFDYGTTRAATRELWLLVEAETPPSHGSAAT